MADPHTMYDWGAALWLIALWLIEVQIGTEPISPGSQTTAPMNIIHPEKTPFFQIGIVELKLYRESWTFGEISLFVMFSGGFCEAYQLSRVQTTKVQFTASLLCNPFWERGQALKWKRMHQKTVCFTELLHRLDVAMLIELPVTIVTSPACIRIIWYISYIYICICIIWYNILQLRWPTKRKWESERRIFVFNKVNCFPTLSNSQLESCGKTTRLILLPEISSSSWALFILIWSLFKSYFSFLLWLHLVTLCLLKV